MDKSPESNVVGMPTPTNPKPELSPEVEVAEVTAHHEEDTHKEIEKSLEGTGAVVHGPTTPALPETPTLDHTQFEPRPSARTDLGGFAASHHAERQNMINETQNKNKTGFLDGLLNLFKSKKQEVQNAG